MNKKLLSDILENMSNKILRLALSEDIADQPMGPVELSELFDTLGELFYEEHEEDIESQKSASPRHSVTRDFTDITHQLKELYERKNADYGDAFSKTFAKHGMTSTCIRLGDKLQRLESLTKNQVQHIHDESIEDTLMDIANYAIMALMELRKG